jgi:hypothetical protein
MTPGQDAAIDAAVDHYLDLMLAGAPASETEAAWRAYVKLEQEAEA